MIKFNMITKMLGSKANAKRVSLIEKRLPEEEIKKLYDCFKASDGINNKYFQSLLLALSKIK